MCSARLIALANLAMRPGNGLVVSRRPGVRVFRREDFSEELALSVLDWEPAVDELLKTGREGRIYRLDTQLGPLCVKEVRHENLLRGLFATLFASENRRAWQAAHVLASLDIPVAQPLALLETGRYLVRRSFFISRFAEGRQPLDRYYEEIPSALSPREKFAFVLDLATFLRRFHALGIYHRDLAPQNFLVRRVGDHWDFMLVDLESVHLRRRLSLTKKMKNLIQLSAMYPDPYSFLLRHRFMRDYSGGDGEFYERSRLRELKERVLMKRAYCRVKYIEEHGHDAP